MKLFQLSPRALLTALLFGGSVAVASAQLTIIHEMNFDTPTNANMDAYTGVTPTNYYASLSVTSVGMAPIAGNVSSGVFDGGTFGYGSDWDANTLGTQGYGIEVWVKPSTASGFIAQFGNTGGGVGAGLSLSYSGGQYQYREGATFVNSGISLAGAGSLSGWDHVAIVRDAGVTTFFVNGASVASSSANPGLAAPNNEWLWWVIPGDGVRYLGMADNLKFFTFATGTFSSSQLDYASAVPEPSTYAAIAGALALGFVAYRRRKAA